jgi:hypothetical protein
MPHLLSYLGINSEMFCEAKHRVQHFFLRRKFGAERKIILYLCVISMKQLENYRRIS